MTGSRKGPLDELALVSNLGPALPSQLLNGKSHDSSFGYPPATLQRISDNVHEPSILVEFSGKTGVLVSPPIPEFPWMHRRQHRGALTLVANPGEDIREAANAYRDVARMLLYKMQHGGQK